MRRHFFLYPMIILTLSGCDGDSHQESVAFQKVDPLFYANPLSAVDPTVFGEISENKSIYYSFDSQRTFSNWWNRATNRHQPKPAPTIDFTEQTVVGVYLGFRHSGCYSVRIEEASLAGGELIIKYREIHPSTGDACSAVSVYPIDLVSVKTSGYPVRFFKIT